MKKIVFALICATLPAAPASAQALFTGNYSQNFDALGPSGTTTTVLGSGVWTTWRFGGGTSTWVSSVSAADLSSGVLVNDTSTAQNGQAPLGLFFNPSFPNFTRFGSVNAGGSLDPNDSDRSLGTAPTGVAGQGLQLSLTNNTGGALSTINLAYDTTVLDRGSFDDTQLLGYRLFYSLTGAGGTWIAASSLDTVTQVTDAQFTQYNVNGALNLAGGWAPGSSLLIRWIDDNGLPSPDQMLAIDNVAVTAAVAAVPEPATWGMMVAGFGVVGGALRKRRRAVATA